MSCSNKANIYVIKIYPKCQSWYFARLKHFLHKIFSYAQVQDTFLMIKSSFTMFFVAVIRVRMTKGRGKEHPKPETKFPWSRCAGCAEIYFFMFSTFYMRKCKHLYIWKNFLRVLLLLDLPGWRTRVTRVSGVQFCVCRLDCASDVWLRLLCHPPPCPSLYLGRVENWVLTMQETAALVSCRRSCCLCGICPHSQARPMGQTGGVSSVYQNSPQNSPRTLNNLHKIIPSVMLCRLSLPWVTRGLAYATGSWIPVSEVLSRQSGLGDPTSALSWEAL